MSPTISDLSLSVEWCELVSYMGGWKLHVMCWMLYWWKWSWKMCEKLDTIMGEEKQYSLWAFVFSYKQPTLTQNCQHWKLIMPGHSKAGVARMTERVREREREHVCKYMWVACCAQVLCQILSPKGLFFTITSTICHINSGRTMHCMPLYKAYVLRMLSDVICIAFITLPRATYRSN
jgi:hypothetical protein